MGKGNNTEGEGRSRLLPVRWEGGVVKWWWRLWEGGLKNLNRIIHCCRGFFFPPGGEWGEREFIVHHQVVRYKRSGESELAAFFGEFLVYLPSQSKKGNAKCIPFHILEMTYSRYLLTV